MQILPGRSLRVLRNEGTLSTGSLGVSHRPPFPFGFLNGFFVKLRHMYCFVRTIEYDINKGKYEVLKGDLGYGKVCEPICAH